ncbi:MAG TPA: hypothetical protein VFE30_09620 [Anaeromyxobacteraceae bacterium]|nr:hypothetical protein [Anaeromyxobacteraceae bacterium]
MVRPALRSTAIALAVATAVAGCSRRGDRERHAAATEAAPAAASPHALCAALHALPAARRASCCGGPAATDLSARCEATLSEAVAGGGLALAAEPVETCVRALDAAYQGCGWVGPFGAPLPPECAAVAVGRRAAGDPCRSSLECQGGLHCAGVTPSRPGRCAGSAPAGTACGTGVDPLAALLRLDADRLRPECAGACRQHACVAPGGRGAACVSSAGCGAGLRCADGRCFEGAVAHAGEACGGGDCAPGLRCVAGRCLTPRPAGTPCRTDFECLGGCVRSDGGASTCGMRCDLR